MVNNFKRFLKVVRNFRTNLITIAILLVIIYFVPIDTPTGFVVNEDSNLDVEVQERAFYEGEVEVIVKLKDVEGKNFLYDNQEADIEAVKGEIKQEFVEKRDLDELDSFAGKISKKGLEKLERHPNVEFVQVDHVFSLSLVDSVPLISATKLHDSEANITGRNVGVCVLDTGIYYSHVDLVDNYVDGYDYVNDDSDPLDDHGHGTHVSGIVQGVSPDVKLLHIKVLNNLGSGSESDIVAGINWCINNKDIHNITVVSMSLGAGLYTSYCDSSFPTLTSAINNAISNNIMVVGSSGNDGSTSSISSPGCIENTTAVGAIDKSDVLASYGNRNGLIDLVAPGSSISSTANGGGYTTLSGTSMSAPHVSGGVALIQQYAIEYNGGYLDSYSVEDLLQDNAVDVSSYKRIDVYESVIKLDNTVPNVILDSPVSRTYSENNISLNYSASDVFLEKVYYHLDGNNVTIDGNTTINVDGGSYTLTLYAEDGNDNLNFSSVNFSVGLPGVTLYEPDDNFNDVDGIVEFNCSITSDAGVGNISLYHDVSGSFELNQSVEFSNVIEGNAIFNLNLNLNLTLIWNCLGYDDGGNYDWGENRTLRVGVNDAPVILGYNPNVTSVSISEPGVQVFNVSYNDSDGDLVNVSWYLDSAFVSTGDNYSYGGNYTNSGNYTVLVVVSDDYDLNDSLSWSFNVLDVEYCGDDVKNSTEECDGVDFGGLTCEDYGYNTGSLSCDSCSISSSGCGNTTSEDGNSGGGSSGGGDSGSSSGSLEAFSDLNSDFGDEDVNFDEEIIEEAVGVETSSEEEVVQEIEPEIVEEKSYGWLFGALAAIVGGGLLLLFLRKEWKIIMKRK